MGQHDRGCVVSLDWDKLKVGDKLTYVGQPTKDLWIDAISDQGAVLGGVYVHSPHGFWTHLSPGSAHSHQYSLRPPPPLIDPDTVWVKLGDEVYRCECDGCMYGRAPHFRITATEPVEP